MNIKSIKSVLFSVATAVLSVVTVPAYAEISLSPVPLFVKQSSEPNVMVLLDTSGSMGSTVEVSGIYEAAYVRTDVNYSYQVCTSANSSNTACRNNGWAQLTGNNLSSGVRVNCASGYSLVRRVSNGSAVAGGTTCVRLPTSLTVSDGGGNSYTYEIEYLYYLIFAHPNSNLRTGYLAVDVRTRMDVAKDVLSGTGSEEGILDIDGVRFGLATFAGSGLLGGKIVAACTDRDANGLTALKSTVNGLSPGGHTPLAESYYEVTRYFRGLTPHFYTSYTGSPDFMDGANYKNPMNSSCQKNFVIAVTDGYPTNDGYSYAYAQDRWGNWYVSGVNQHFPTNDPFDVADATRALPNWDNVRTDDPIINNAVRCDNNQNRTFLSFSDGMRFQLTGLYACANADPSDEGSSLLLDDLALFASQMDLKTSAQLDDNGRAYNALDNISTYTVGFAVDNQMLEDAAEYGGGEYYTANNSSQLRTALQGAMSQIEARRGSGSAVATSSSRLDTEETIYQALFYSGEWSGQINAYSVTSENGRLVISDNPTWTTGMSSFPAHASRKIFTSVAGTGAAFNYANLNAANMLNGLTEAQINWLRGDQSNEVANNGTLRNRQENDADGNDTLLGDIVNSDPVFAGKNLDFALDKLPTTFKDGSLSIATTYRAFVNANKENASFKSVLYVGANDGMLHAFDADTGRELFAYVPSTLLPRLGQLTDPNYTHQYFVDGSAVVSHAYIDGQWRTILVGSTGFGGVSGTTIFALDVTDPTNFDASDVLWEYSSANLGFTNGTPYLAPVASGNSGAFAVIVPNGYKSSAEQTAKLIVLNAETGAELAVLDTQSGSTATAPNGLSPITLVPGADRLIDIVYAGDLRGNVWKFDVSDGNSGRWGSAFAASGVPAPLFSALGTDGLFQPITAPIAVTRHTDDGYMLVFGTGKYMETFDADGSASGGAYDKDLQTQTAYGIQDTGVRITGRSQLQERERAESEAGDPDGTFRIDDEDFDSSKKGWYLDLGFGDTDADNTYEGERIVVGPVIRQGRAVFLTGIPDSDPCGSGGSSRLIEVMAETGAAPDEAVFDTNDDGEVDDRDSTYSGMVVQCNDCVGGGDGNGGGGNGELGLQVGLTIITNDKVEYKLTSGAGGTLTVTTERSEGGSTSRGSWRQIK